jgi:anti-sigma factor RsiW
MSDRPFDPRLRAVLGPAGPELSCEQCFEELDRFVELELAGEDAEAAIPGLRAHLEGCPACREEHESLRALVGSESARPTR